MSEIIASIDWAHKKPYAVYTKEKQKSLELEKLIPYLKEIGITTVVTENIPEDASLLLLQSNIKVLRCSGTSTKEYRDSINRLKESDELDAQTIFELYDKFPDFFIEYTEEDKKFLRAKALWRVREALLKARVQFDNRINAFLDNNTFDKDTVDKLKELHKQMQSKEDYLSRIFAQPDYFGKYIKLFEDVKGIGEITVAGVVSEIGNINRFKTQSQFLNYVFGYGHNNKHNRKLKTKFMLAVENMNRSGNEEYNALYHSYKEYLEKKHPETIKYTKEDGKIGTKYNPAHLTTLTKRRVAREIAKMFYHKLRATTGREMLGHRIRNIEKKPMPIRLNSNSVEV